MHDSNFGCGISNLHVSHKSARIVYREHTFTPGQFIYWNHSDKDYNLAFEGNCSFLVVAVDNCGTWFEVACVGEYEIDNFDITGETYLDAQGKLTATPTKTKVGFIENGNIFLSIQTISETGIAQVNADWNATTGLAKILNKPILFSGDYNDLSNLPTLFSGKYSDLVGKPSLFSGSYYDLTNLPMLFSGSYNDLTDAPIIPAAQVNADWNATSGVAQILNKPNISTFNPADVDYLTFDTTPETTSSAIGTVSWNNTDMTLDVVQTNGTVLQVGQEFQIRVVNKSGVAIPNGHVVYLTGAQGNRITAALARSDAFATSQAIAIATEDIAVNAEGFVTKLGLVRDINTSTFTEGSAVYLSSTIAGDIIQSAPTPPNRTVRIGYVVRSHATVGSIFVTIDSTPTFDDISDISVSTVTDGQSIAYDSATKTWVPYTPSTGGGSSIPMIAGSGEASLVGNVPLDPTRSIADYSTSLGIQSKIEEGAVGSIAWGLQSHIGTDSMFATAGGYNAVIGNNSTGAVALGLNVSIGNGCDGATALGLNNSIEDACSASFTSGINNTITGPYAFATGQDNTVSAPYAYAEGYGNSASNLYSHVEGYVNTSSGAGSHAEGYFTRATATGAHAEGYGGSSPGILASGEGSHAEGSVSSVASGKGSHSEGWMTTASGYASHCEGGNNTASGYASHCEGYNNIANGDFSHAEGYQTTASGMGSHAEGLGTVASGNSSHAEGWTTHAIGDYSHSEGYLNDSDGIGSHAEGYQTKTLSGSMGAHAEGYQTTASGMGSHAEGLGTVASASSHAEGLSSQATGSYSHAEGETCIASGQASHAEAYHNIASGIGSHAEGQNNVAKGDYSHVEGTNNIAALAFQNVAGIYAIDDTGYAGTNPKLHKIGNGDVANSIRKDIYFVRADGTIGTAAFKTNGTGSPTGLGSKCPAATPTVPYAWIQFELSDGSTVYMPAWK